MLTDTAIRNVKPPERPRKLFDERGLYLLLNPDGSRYWRLKYRIAGREKQISLGVHPNVGLKLARDRRDEARKLVAAGVDPSAHRKAEKLARLNTLEDIARECLDHMQKPPKKGSRAPLSRVTVEKALWMLETFVFPRLGSHPIASITPTEVLKVLRKIEGRGTHETAHRTKQRCGRVFRYAIATGRAERDVTADLRGALAAVVPQNHAAITEPKKVGELLVALDAYQGQPTVAGALRLAPIVFVRPGELRAAEWVEFDLDGDEPEWRVPAQRMKMREQHIVPLARQAVEVLRALKTLSRNSHLVFPSLRSAKRPMSENTLNAALRRLGYAKDEMTAHGFRSVASTFLNELGWAPDLIEPQLAHAERNKVRAAYNRAERLPERRRMMQAWADHLDSLKAQVATRT